MPLAACTEVSVLQASAIQVSAIQLAKTPTRPYRRLHETRRMTRSHKGKPAQARVNAVPVPLVNINPTRRHRTEGMH
jgi:hypothetical protein